jgi:hypothetical protein
MDEKADPESLQAFLFIFAAIAVFVAVMLYVTHRINKRTCLLIQIIRPKFGSFENNAYLCT